MKMVKVATTDEYGNVRLSDNDLLLKSVLDDLARNNTAFPDITDAYYFKKEVKTDQKDGDGHRIRVLKNTLRVYFADGTWTDVTQSDEDNEDVVTALLYAIVKRLLGVPTEGGCVCGCGFMNTIKNLVASIRTPETEKKEKEDRIAAKLESDRKAHEDAVVRRGRRHRDDRSERIDELENKFKTLSEKIDGLVDVLNGGACNFKKSNPSKKRDKKCGK